MVEEWTPFFATKKVIKDYEPLRKYLEKVKGTEWYDKAFISESDFKLLRESAKDLKTKKLGELWDKLTEKFLDRVEPKAALEALKECGYEVKDEQEARKRIAEILAGWLLEAGEEWDLIRFRTTPPENDRRAS